MALSGTGGLALISTHQQTSGYCAADGGSGPNNSHKGPQHGVGDGNAIHCLWCRYQERGSGGLGGAAATQAQGGGNNTAGAKGQGAPKSAALIVAAGPEPPRCSANNWLGTSTFITPATVSPSINQGADSINRAIKLVISSMPITSRKPV